MNENINEKKHTGKSYEELHRPASEFKTRSEYLDNELKIMNPKRWSLNLPKRDYNIEMEDFVPAIAGTIGKIVLTTAVVSAFATAYAARGHVLPPGFVVENVRFEILIATLLFVIPVSAFINPRSNLPGCHGPMIPVLGMVIAAGGHPLALGVLMGIFGLIVVSIKGGSRLVTLTGNGVKGGLLIFFGYVGLAAQITALRAWSRTPAINNELIFLVVIVVTLLSYTYLVRIGKKWLAIPICALLGLVVALGMGAPFTFRTTPGIPELSPFYWWGTETGWMLGLPGMGHIIASLPFAILSVALWPPDFLSHRVFQEMNYPKGSEKVLMDVDDTMINTSVRQIVGSTLGGGNVTSSWGTYIIPAGIAKRPIPAGALLLGIILAAAVLIGYPMDLAIFPPVLRAVLIVGVFLPLIEAGMPMIPTIKEAQTATLCIFGSLLINPVFGWAFTMLLDNSGIIGDIERSRSLSTMDRVIIPLVTVVICTGAMAAVGIIPGIPALI